MVVNEYGVTFVLAVSYNMAAFTSLTLTFTKPSGGTLVATSPSVSAPNVAIATSLGTFLAREYAQYTFVQGDVDEAGTWRVRLTYVDSTKRLYSTPVSSFVVLA